MFETYMIMRKLYKVTNFGGILNRVAPFRHTNKL